MRSFLILTTTLAAIALGGCGKSSSSGSHVLVDSNASGQTGAINPNGMIATTPGQAISITAEPHAGYTVDWTGTTADADPSLTHTIIAPASGTKTVTVTFVPTSGG